LIEDAMMRHSRYDVKSGRVSAVRGNKLLAPNVEQANNTTLVHERVCFSSDAM